MAFQTINPGTPGVDGSGDTLNLFAQKCADNFSQAALASTSVTGTWRRRGTVIGPPPTHEYSAQEPSVIYDNNAQILSVSSSTNVFKVWFTAGWNTQNILYAESLDGEIFVYGDDTGPSLMHAFVLKANGQYYLFGAQAPTATVIKIYTSSTGLNGSWALLSASAISLPSGYSAFGNVGVIVDTTNWKMLFEAQHAGTGQWAIFAATSTDSGTTWTVHSSTPVLTSAGGPQPMKIGSTYYMWANHSLNGLLPSDVYLYKSSDFYNWSLAQSTPALARETADEGVYSSTGQLADVSITEAAGKTYCFYAALPNQSGYGAHIKLAICDLPLSDLVVTPQTSLPRRGDADYTGYLSGYTFQNIGRAVFGSAITPLSLCHITQTTTDKSGLFLSGSEITNDTLGNSLSGGVSIQLLVNRTNNRQILINGSDNVNNPSTGGVRIISGSGSPQIDGVSGYGANGLQLLLGNSTSGVYIDGHAGFGISTPVSSISIGGSTKAIPLSTNFIHYSINTNVDQGMVGWNCYWNGSSLARQNASLGSVRLGCNVGNAHNAQVYFVTMAGTGGTDISGFTLGMDAAGTGINAQVNNGSLSVNNGLGVFGSTPPSSKPTVTGSRGSNAALASLLTALAACGLITDSSS